MTAKILTANRLTDGVVVFLAEDGAWTEHLHEACIAGDEDARTALAAEGERAVAARTVVAPYLIDVAAGQDGPRPVRLRELIRAIGPTVRPDLARPQAEGF